MRRHPDYFSPRGLDVLTRAKDRVGTDVREGPHEPIAANKPDSWRRRYARQGLYGKIVLCKYKRVRPRIHPTSGCPVNAHHRAVRVSHFCFFASTRRPGIPCGVIFRLDYTIRSSQESSVGQGVN